MLTRRTLLTAAAGLGAATLLPPGCAGPSTRRGRGKQRLDVAVIGVANRGRANLDGVAGENVVALCDVDARYLSGAAERFPEAATFRDLRRLLAEVPVDAVVVSSADHTHAQATLLALAAGCHVYCEKPLAHDVAEARAVARAAADTGATTQMGIQIHSGDNYRRVVEAVRAGAVGTVREVHVLCGKSWSAAGRPAEVQPVPEHLDYDLWLGPREPEPFHGSFHPAGWRRYWPFGGGTLGDMACHWLDLPFWALGLGHPERVAASGPEVDPFATPRWLEVRYRFAASEHHGQLELTWWDGGRRPAELLASLGAGDWTDGVLFLGDEGALISNYDRHELLPAGRTWQAPPPTIPRSIGQHAEWLDAIKRGGPTTCDFAYSGALTEAVLLGHVAYRHGAPIRWDASSLTATGEDGRPVDPSLLAGPRREGWELPAV